ncbi:hypothetical protein K0U83_05590 [bacterium]|nr:hypothetical protein [bacterium]
MRTQTMNDYRLRQLEARVTEQLARLGRIVTAVEAGDCNAYEALAVAQTIARFAALTGEATYQRAEDAVVTCEALAWNVR